MRCRSFAPLALAVMALLHGAPSRAGGASGQFGVNITLSTVAAPGFGAPTTTATTTSPSSMLLPSGMCRSRTLTESDSASVEVACQSGQFVSIAADPEASFLGLRDDAFRYSISFRTELSVWTAAPTKGDVPRLGWGTVTALRVYDLSPPDGTGDGAWDQPLDMLVTF